MLARFLLALTVLSQGTFQHKLFAPGMFTHWILQTIAMLLTAAVLPRMYITSLLGAFGVVIALGFVNATIWDAALFFSIPNSITTHTLLVLVANGVLLWVLTKLLPGIVIEGLLPAIVAPVVFTIFSVLVSRYGREIDWINLFHDLVNNVTQARDYLKSAPTPIPTAIPVPTPAVSDVAF